MTPGGIDRRGALAAGLLLAGGARVRAEAATTLIVPAAVGGTLDGIGRLVAPIIERGLGRPVNAVNRPGGGGLVGHGALALAAPDGATLGLVTGELALHRFAGVADLGPDQIAPLALLGRIDGVVLVRAGADARSLPDLAAAIRQAPGRLRFSGGPAGGFWTLAALRLFRDLEIDVQALTIAGVPTTARAAQDLAAGHLDVALVPLVDALAAIDAGAVRALAVTAPERVRMRPTIPALPEAVPGAAALGSPVGLAGPPGLPPALAAAAARVAATVAEPGPTADALSAAGLTGTSGDAAALIAALADVERLIARGTQRG